MLARRLAWLLLGILNCCCLAFGPPVMTDSDTPRQQLAPHQIRALRQVPVPEITAAAAILVNPSSGQILYARNEHERRAPASLVKIVTALVALQRGRQDQEFRVNNEDLRAYSAVGLQNGELLNLRHLLFLMLVPSDNSAASTIARGVGKDTRTFVGWMNEFVAGLGLKDTHFANPHGLDHKDGYSTAYDLAIIARYAMANPTFAEIVSHAEAIAADRRVKTTNELLSTYPGTIGVKTGTEEMAGECLITLVDRPVGQCLGVLLGSTDRYTDMRLLMDYFYATFAEVHIDLPATPQNRYLDEQNNWHELTLSAPVTLLISPWQTGYVSLYRRIDDFSVNPDPAKPVGVIEVHVGGRPMTEVPIYAR